MAMDRKQFIKLAGGTLALGALARPFAPDGAAAAGLAPRQYGGADLSGWNTVLGDGLWAADGQAPLHSGDVATSHNGQNSVLQANVGQRGVMAHNITYDSRWDTTAFEYVHKASLQFRLPAVPNTGLWPYNAQTFEAGFFIWDGAQTRRDYGCAFQWVLNPWMSTFGTIYCWMTDASNQWWAPCGYLAPDTNWHTMEFTFAYHYGLAGLKIDNYAMPLTFTATPKPSDWGTEIAARFQAEIISVWPGQNSAAPMHLAEVKNWQWKWEPYAV